ncbi:IclR family transcriptional regulator C-terminal domain-containing protein [Streptomyces sp. NPDC102270]|uniref:IclR family transcriptional regulator domain-containing protein n=1 Tax=Streptomyces sp. NPDC102270 TaxID=3366150 RepID=UPI00382579FB
MSVTASDQEGVELERRARCKAEPAATWRTRMVAASSCSTEDVLFLERLSAPNVVINYTRIAGRLSLHASSSGLVLLAYGPTSLKEAVPSGPLIAYTSATPAEPTRLRAVLAEARQQGYAYCPGRVHQEALGIAAPIRGAEGAVVAAPSVIVPSESSAHAVVPVVRMAARGISRARQRL